MSHAGFRAATKVPFITRAGMPVKRSSCLRQPSLTLLRAGQYTALLKLYEVLNTMLLSRDYVGYMAGEVVKRLLDAKMIETPAPDALTQRVRSVMQYEVSIEDKLNEEVRQILTQYADEMKRTGASYQEMYKKVKGELARQRKLILR